jgi:hypothetical protein
MPTGREAIGCWWCVDGMLAYTVILEEIEIQVSSNMVFVVTRYLAGSLLAVWWSVSKAYTKWSDNGIPSGSDLSSLTLETSNALLSPLRSHFRGVTVCDVMKLEIAFVGVDIEWKTALEDSIRQIIGFIMQQQRDWAMALGVDLLKGRCRK